MSLFQNVALGITAYNSIRTNQNTAETNAAMQAMLEFQQVQVQAQSQQQNLRDMIFRIQSSIEDQFPQFDSEQALYWSTWLLNKFAIEGIGPDAASELADKQAIRLTQKNLENIQAASTARLEADGQRADRPSIADIVENARLSFTIPYLQQLAKLAVLRAQLVDSGKTGFQKPLWPIPLAIACALGGVFALLTIVTNGVVTGISTFFGITPWLAAPALLVAWIIRRTKDAIPPKNWDLIQQNAREANYLVNKTTSEAEVGLRMSFVEDQLTCVGEEKQSNWRGYIPRFEQARSRFLMMEEKING